MIISIEIPDELKQDLLDTFMNYNDYDNSDPELWAKNKIMEFVKSEIKSFKLPVLLKDQRETIENNLDIELSVIKEIINTEIK